MGKHCERCRSVTRHPRHTPRATHPHPRAHTTRNRNHNPINLPARPCELQRSKWKDRLITSAKNQLKIDETLERQQSAVATAVPLIGVGTAAGTKTGSLDAVAYDFSFRAWEQAGGGWGVLLGIGYGYGVWVHASWVEDMAF